MLRQPLFEMYRVALDVALAMPLLGAFVRREELWFDSRLASILRGSHFNVMLTMIVVVLGLSATLITSMLPIFGLGAIAFFLPLDRRERAKFVMMGGLSIALGTLAVLDLPLSLISATRFGGSIFAASFLGMVDLYSIFCIAAIGIFSLFFLRSDYRDSGPI
jgi:predicted cation transporter